jgi:hypothetical protein
VWTHPANDNGFLVDGLSTIDYILSMIDIAIKGRPANRDEIRQALSAKAAFAGHSLASLSVQDLNLAPYILKNLLNGITINEMRTTLAGVVGYEKGASEARKVRK